MVLPGAGQRLVNIFFDGDEDEAEPQFFIGTLCGKLKGMNVGSPKRCLCSGAVPASRNVNLFN